MQPPPNPPAAAPYAPPPTYAPPPRSTKTLTAESLTVFIGILIGALVTAGFISYHAAFLIVPTCTGTFCPAPTAAQSLAYNLAWIFVITMDLALGLSICIAFVAGGASSQLPEGTKRGVFVFAAVFLVAWLILGIIFSVSFLSILVRF